MRIMPSGYVMSKQVMQPPVRRHVPPERQSENNVLKTACLHGSQNPAHTKYNTQQTYGWPRIACILGYHFEKFLAKAQGYEEEGCTAMPHSNHASTFCDGDAQVTIAK